MDIHVGHVNSAIAINDIDRFIIFHCFCTPVQLLDKRYQMRHNFIQEIKWPFFQCFRQDGMVGVSSHIFDNLNCFIKGNTTQFQKTNQFWNDQRWMSIIDLNHSIIS